MFVGDCIVDRDRFQPFGSNQSPGGCVWNQVEVQGPFIAQNDVASVAHSNAVCTCAADHNVVTASDIDRVVGTGQIRSGHVDVFAIGIEGCRTCVAQNNVIASAGMNSIRSVTCNHKVASITGVDGVVTIQQ